jgi:hypothetical protein
MPEEEFSDSENESHEEIKIEHIAFNPRFSRDIKKLLKKHNSKELTCEKIVKHIGYQVT